MLSLEDRVIVVSGANRGIGLAIAKRLHQDGAIVSLGARDVAALQAATASLADERVHRQHYDALEDGSDAEWIDGVTAQYGRIDGLVNCAGILEPFTVEAGDEAVLDRMFAVNVKAPLRLTRLALPSLRASGQGRIVNLSSLSGIRVANDEVGYGMSKFAVTALSHATKRVGWDDGVRVTNLCPGYVATDMPTMLDPDLDADSIIQPDDLAELTSTVMRLPNNASVAQLNVACRLESMI